MDSDDEEEDDSNEDDEEYVFFNSEFFSVTVNASKKLHWSAKFLFIFLSNAQIYRSILFTKFLFSNLCSDNSVILLFTWVNIFFSFPPFCSDDEDEDSDDNDVKPQKNVGKELKKVRLVCCFVVVFLFLLYKQYTQDLKI